MITSFILKKAFNKPGIIPHKAPSKAPTSTAKNHTPIPAALVVVGIYKATSKAPIVPMIY